jgi:AraC family transcriptional regulator of adaptative response/methylated-DNA-[protein]-cysteine methyltransferase
MTPAEYKNGGKSLTINYSFAHSPFGQILVASTPKGICHVAFHESEDNALFTLKSNFPKASYLHQVDPIQQSVITYFESSFQSLPATKLHIMGTEFQLKVWEALLKIPQGTLASYGTLATAINKPSASRTVGTAIGSNPIAYLIPCHRVIQASGALGGYMWGTNRKAALIGWEMAKSQTIAPHN